MSGDVDVPMLTEASEYRGQRAISVACTQLGPRYSSTRARRVVDEWIDLFAVPTPLTELRFTSRTPRRLFAALSGQPQLLRLEVKWGDYADLGPLGSMTGLRHLELRGASAVTDVRPLAALRDLRLLALEGFRTIDDPSPLGNLRRLVDLEIGGAWTAPRNGHISTIGWVQELRELENVVMHTVVVDDRDYRPLLDLPKLRAVRVMKVRGMRPAHDELRRLLPWSG